MANFGPHGVSVVALPTLKVGEAHNFLQETNFHLSTIWKIHKVCVWGGGFSQTPTHISQKQICR